MKFTSAIFVTAFVTSALSAPLKPVKRDVDPNLIPQFGHASGVNPTGTGDCDGVPGANGQPVKVPCACPPDRDAFIASLNANVAAGHAINNPSVQLSFPTDDSVASQLARLNAATVTLQNLNGPGQGCPSASTTFGAQGKAIQAGQSAPSTAPEPAVPAQAPVPAQSPAEPAPNPASSSDIDTLVPQLGFQSGVNPTGTGDCDGAVQGKDGNPVKIPCACPPTQADFIEDVKKNIDAGKVINNPGVPFSFPTDNSRDSQAARVRAALVTLQNLNGPGEGCPAASTTLTAQLNALQ